MDKYGDTEGLVWSIYGKRLSVHTLADGIQQMTREDTGETIRGAGMTEAQTANSAGKEDDFAIVVKRNSDGTVRCPVTTSCKLGAEAKLLDALEQAGIIRIFWELNYAD